MKLAIMQPYLFPYLGYFQMLACVDKLVFYDDVNFIKNGWINRNRLLLDGQPRYFTIPLAGASAFRPIAEIEVQPAATWRRKLLATFQQAYSRAPCFDAVFRLVTEVFEAPTMQIAEIAKRSVAAVGRYLGLPATLEWTSSVYANASLRGSERVLDVCRREGARDYYNLPGGRALYDAAQFAAAGVRLHFVDVQLPPYRHNAAEFQPGLSVIDVLMWNERTVAARMVTGALAVAAAAQGA